MEKYIKNKKKIRSKQDNEVFQETPLPTVICAVGFIREDIVVINDFVTLIVEYHDTKNMDCWFDIWPVISSEIGVERAWTKKFKVEGSGLDFDNRLLKVR